MVSASLAAVAVLLAVVAVWVLLARPQSAINRWFSAYTLAIAGWTVSIGSLHTALAPELWSRLAFLSSSFIPACFLAFTTVFPSVSPWPPRRVIRGVLLLATILAALSVTTPLLIHDAVVTPTGFTRQSGPLYPLFVGYFLGACITAFVVFALKWRRERGQARTQLQYLGIGLFLSFVGGITTNILLPFLMGRTAYTWLGPYFTLPLVIFVSHAIIRHRLMNARLFVRRSIVYLITVAITGTVFASFLVGWTTLIGERRERVPLAVEVAVALAVALAFQPLKRWLQNQLDRYFYRETYNYEQIVRDASQTISSTLDLKSLLQYVCEVTSTTLRTDLVVCFTRDLGRDAFRVTAKNDFGGGHGALESINLSPSDPLPSFLIRTRRPVYKEDLDRDLTGPDAIAAVQHLSRLGGELVLPILSETQLTGFLVVGPKLSGDAFFAEDVDLLSTLTSQAAIAIKNAQLYQQVILANEYIQNILATMDSGVITIDSKGRVALCNSTAARMTNLSISKLVSLALDDLPDPFALQLRLTLSDGQPRVQTESTLRVGPDRWVPIVCSTSALRDDQDTIIGALVVFSDLSRLKALESEKRRAERLAAFGTLVSGIAHEIKNPLVAIRTFAELLPERFTDVDFRETFAKVVVAEIGRIDDLVAKLRGLVVPSLQQAPIADVRESIMDTLALLSGQLEQTRTTVRRAFLDLAPLVAVDPNQLKQLFLNLFQNAIEAMGHGGALTVRVRRGDTHDTPTVLVEVEDTGPGIPESIRNSIFNPFFTTKEQGTGLGLAICRGITDAHHGTIRADTSDEGHGTTITVEFPAATEPAETVRGGVSA
jgi:signal transduction histidine kinase